MLVQWLRVAWQDGLFGGSLAPEEEDLQVGEK